MKTAATKRVFDLLTVREMIRKQNRLFSIVPYLILIITLCLSCGDEKNIMGNSPDEYVHQIKAEAEEIAQAHNEILRMIYENKEKSSANILERVYHSAREYYTSFHRRR